MRASTIIHASGTAILLMGLVRVDSWWSVAIVAGVVLQVITIPQARLAKRQEVLVLLLQPRAFLHPHGQRVVIFGDYPILALSLLEAGFVEISREGALS